MEKVEVVNKVGNIFIKKEGDSEVFYLKKGVKVLETWLFKHDVLALISVLSNDVIDMIEKDINVLQKEVERMENRLSSQNYDNAYKEHLEKTIKRDKELVQTLLSIADILTKYHEFYKRYERLMWSE